jgi:ribokinase
MLVVFGSINADLVFKVPVLPRPGETVLCPSFETLPGGKGANQAVAAARAGAAVRFFGGIGQDAQGLWLRRSLESAGIDCDGLLQAPDPTGVAVIGVDPGGENAIIVASGANLAARAAAVPDRSLGPGATLLCQNELASSETLALLDRAGRHGARTILNLAPVGHLRPGDLPRLDVLVVNEHELSALTGAPGIESGIAELVGRHARTVVVTLGHAGAVAVTPTRELRMPAIAVEVVDTTGAGDAFVGVLAAALDEGRALDMTLRLAIVAGGLACERLGAQSALPARSEIERRLREQMPDAATALTSGNEADP